MNTLDSLLKAKELSDTSQYSPKARIMFDLMTRDPQDFQVDSTDPRGGHPGVTHIPTGFRMHVPWKYIPASVGSRREDIDSQEDTGFAKDELEKEASEWKVEEREGSPKLPWEKGKTVRMLVKGDTRCMHQDIEEEDRHKIPEDGSVRMWRYGYILEMDDGSTLKTKTNGVRNTRNACGGQSEFIVHDGEVYGPVPGSKDNSKQIPQGTKEAVQQPQATQAPPANPFVTHLDSERYFGRPGSVLRAQDILEAANAHGVDPRLLASVVANESAWGTHPRAVESNNFSGMMGSGSELYEYATPQEGLGEAARLLRTRYIDRGLDTPETIGPVYAPTVGATNDPTGMNNNWVSTVSSIMNRIPQPVTATPPPPQPTPPPTSQPVQTPPVTPGVPPHAQDMDTVGNQTTPAIQMGQPPLTPVQPRPTPKPTPKGPIRPINIPTPQVKRGSDEDDPEWDEEEFQQYIQSHREKRASLQAPATPTGSRQLLEALQGINLDDLERKARETIKSGPKSKRGEAVKRLNIIEGLRRNQVSPQDLMIKQVPVLPAQFRPYSAQGTTFIPGDANVLYKDLMNMRRAYDEERAVFGEDGAGTARASLYDAVKAVYGYGPPTNEKARAKGVTGFLEKVTGTGPKTSYVSRRLLGKTQDQTARGTIISAPDLGMDEVGVPREMAWTLFAPYVQRRLVRGGMSPGNALKAVKDRTREAERALEMEIPDRPVVYSRSPAWHKWNVIAGIAKLTDGDGIGMNPFVLEGLSGDFDGDAMNIHLPATEEARKEALEKLMPSKVVVKTRDPDDIMSAPRHEQILGLYTAAQRPARNHWKFPSEAEALQAIQSGRVSLSDEVEITGTPLTPPAAPATLPPLTEPQRNRV